MGVPIFVTDETGALRDMVVCDGSTSVVVERGWSVSAVFASGPELNRAAVHVFSSVVPGDALDFFIRKDPGGVALLDMMTFDFGAAAGGSIGTPCGRTAGTTPVTLNRYTTCSATSFNALVLAYAEIPPAYAVMPVTWAAGTTLTITGYQPMGTFDLSVTDIPPEASTATLSMTTLEEDNGLESPAPSTFMPPPATVSTTFPVQRDSGTARLVGFTMKRTDLGQIGGGQLHNVRVPLADTSLTLQATPMPVVADASIDFVTPAVTMQTIGSGPHVATVFAMHDTRFARTEQTVDWTIVAPADVRRVELPRLPAPYDDWGAAPGDQLAEMEVSLYALDIWPTYREVVRSHSDQVNATSASAAIHLGASDIRIASGYVVY
jgi:hypothetical protein